MHTQTISMLVTVKAYPNVSKRHGEVNCIAGIRTDTQDPAWVRLFPVPFRALDLFDRFEKYQQIELNVSRPVRDRRPESFTPDIDSISLGSVLDSSRNWSKRRPFVEPLVRQTMCELQQQQAKDATSLGIIRPYQVLDFEITDSEEPDWSEEQKAILDMQPLFGPQRQPLEKISKVFHYRYLCNPKCRGHRQSVIDWELHQMWRREADEGTIRSKWLKELCAPDRDTHFFVGNMHQHPGNFLVLGVYWPREDPQGRLPGL